MKGYLLIVGALLGCSDVRSPETRNFDGIFTIGDDTQNFVECRSKAECVNKKVSAETCWIKEPNIVGSAIDGAKLRANNEIEPATFQIKFHGTRSYPTGGTGHMGILECEIEVSKFQYIERIG